MEYTGAPFYAAMSSLKSGSDLVFIFCDHSAAIPIKCYSPEPIVNPIDYSQSIP
jgi:ATP-dependent NAD(P)H-hydrate dehydratase